MNLMQEIDYTEGFRREGIMKERIGIDEREDRPIIEMTKPNNGFLKRLIKLVTLYVDLKHIHKVFDNLLKSGASFCSL